MQTKYFYNSIKDSLVVVEMTDEGEVNDVTELTSPLTVDETEKVEEEEETPAPVVKKERTPNQKASGFNRAPLSRPASYDKAEVRRLILAGTKPADIATETGATVATVYQIKSQMKKDGELVEEKAAAKSGTPLKSHYEQIRQMLEDDHSETEIYNKMHDLMTDTEFRTALEEAKEDLDR